MKKIVYLLIGVMSVMILSCSDKKKDGEDKIFIPDPRTDHGMTRSHEDTIAVMDLANHFLTTLKEKDIEGALDQLYEVDSTDVHPLSAQRRDELRKTLRAFPVEEYTIDQLTLYSENDSEVRYTTKMFPDSIESEFPGITRGCLHPYRIDNQWFLTIQEQKIEREY